MEQSSAARVVIAVIPIVGIVMGSVVVFFTFLWDHRRKMVLIRTGQYRPRNINVGLFSLLAGLLLLSVGVVLTLFFALARGLQGTLLGGLIPLALGIAFLVFYKLTDGCRAFIFKESRDDRA